HPAMPDAILRHSGRVTHAVFSPDGHRIATACADGTVRVWDLAGSFSPPMPASNSFSSDRKRFLTLEQGGLRVWDTVSRQAVSPVIKLRPSNQVSKLNANGRFVVMTTGGTESTNGSVHTVEVLETQTGKRIGPPIISTNRFAKYLLSNDGRHLLVWGGRSAQTWNVPEGRMLARNVLHDERIESGVFNPAGDKVATWSGKVVKIWDATTGGDLFPPLEHGPHVNYSDFSPDGAWLVTCSCDKYFTKCSATIWNMTTRQPACPERKHADGVLFASFSSDSKRVVTASEDFTAIVWDVATGKQLTP